MFHHISVTYWRFRFVCLFIKARAVVGNARLFFQSYSLILLCFRICICFYSAFSRVSSLPRHSHAALALTLSRPLSLSLPNRQFICCRRRRRCSAAAAFAALGFVAFQLASLSTVEVGKETWKVGKSASKIKLSSVEEEKKNYKICAKY